MRSKFITALNFILIVALIVTLFFVLIAYAGGHKIPVKTYWSFGLISLVIVLALLFINFVGRRRRE